MMSLLSEGYAPIPLLSTKFYSTPFDLKGFLILRGAIEGDLVKALDGCEFFL